MGTMLKAQMTLVTALVRIECNESYLEHKMFHGLVYHATAADRDQLKTYFIKLVDKYLTNEVRPTLDQGDKVIWEFIEFGIIAPDDVSLPFAECNTAKAVMAKMEMIVETETDFPIGFGPPPAYLDIEVVART